MEFYDRVLGPKLFDHYGKLLVHAIGDEIAPGAPIQSILEVACGTGQITKYIYEDLAKPMKLDVVATDLSQAAIDVCMRVASDDMRQNVKFQADVDMADLPFADDSFDVIVCGFGLMFPPDKTSVVREFKRVLRPGGKVYATIFYKNELFDLARHEFQKYFGSPSNLLNQALSLSDHKVITSVFMREGLCNGLAEVATLSSSHFFLDEDDTKEFLFNACVLLEEFNQCDTGSREEYLEVMFNAIHSAVPNLEYQVHAWLLRGLVDEECKRSTAAPGALPSFGRLERFGSLRPGSLDEWENDASAQLEDAELIRAFQDAKSNFLLENPIYDDNEVEALRRHEFSRLDAQGEAYLDYVGGSLVSASLVDHHSEVLKTTIFGNPHSGSRTSGEAYQRARADIYRFFRCSPDDYEIIFTSNASNAIRVVAESFPFEQGSELLLTKDNHTSVHGIREFAKAKGASVRYITLTKHLLFLEESMLRATEKLDGGKLHLLAFPAQSNASGAIHDLKWIRIAQERGAMVLCDAAAAVPLSGFDYQSYAPDFLCLSFYKMFGYPTGTGCLIAKRSSLQKLIPHAFSGGSVCYFSGPWSPSDKMLRQQHDRMFEVGTPNYASFHCISYGLNFLSSVGLDRIRGRAVALARWLEAQLSQLRHEIKSKGPLCRIYGPPVDQKGATIMFNFFDCYDSIVPHALVERMAASFGIVVRSGCFCNLGAVQHATYLSAGAEHCEVDKKGKILSCKTFEDEILSKGICGAVRVSFGIGSNFRDAYRFLLFAKSLLNMESARLKDWLGAYSVPLLSELQAASRAQAASGASTSE